MNTRVQGSSIPSFLIKLSEIMNNKECSHVIGWDQSGKNIWISCDKILQQQILPQYFRHNKLASFIRQLNIYGFHKNKYDNNSYRCYTNENFTKNYINFSAFIKKNKIKTKQNILYLSIDNVPQKQLHSELTHHQEQSQIYDQFVQFRFQKNGKLNNDKNQQQSGKTQQIYELIQEFVSKMEPFLPEINWQSFLQLSQLIKDPKYQRINEMALKMVNQQWISPFMNLPKCLFGSNQMQFIL